MLTHVLAALLFGVVLAALHVLIFVVAHLALREREDARARQARSASSPRRPYDQEREAATELAEQLLEIARRA